MIKGINVGNLTVMKAEQKIPKKIIEIPDWDVTERMQESPLEDCIVVQDFLEYKGIDLSQVLERMGNNHLDSSSEFNNMVIRYGDKRLAEIDFYVNSTTYVYDLLSNQASYQGVCNKLLKFLGSVMTEMKAAGPKFMEFGAGCGVLCHIMTEWGEKQVTHVDVQSEAMKFAAWRYKKYGVAVKILPITQDSFVLPETYDVIFTDAVWEHITPEQQIDYAKYLARCVNPDGLFVMIVDLGGVTAREPMHYNVDLKKVHSAIASEGLKLVMNNINTFATVWKRR